MKRIVLVICAAAVLSFYFILPGQIEALNYYEEEDLQQRLAEGNSRFVAGESTFPRLTAERRMETFENGQKPFATIITCSDSRVPVEMVFDQGIGDLFVIRVAGNVCDTDEIGSIEYGVDHLETPLMVVLGHTHCGAVTAVVKNAEVHGSIPELVDNIVPAAERAKESGATGDELIANAVRENVWQSIEDLLLGSPACAERTKSGAVRVIGAIYDIETGAVEWLGEHPHQESLLGNAAMDDHEKH